jgi:uracil phosphoribosyltransferase
MPAADEGFHLVDHPLVADMLARARERDTQPAVFRRLLASMGALLAYEATRDLPTEPITVYSPLEPVKARAVRLPLTIVPILRAGLGMADGIHDLIPAAQMGHIGLYRDEASLQPVNYFERLPGNVSEGPVLLVDPMLATGGSAVSAGQRLRDKGCRDVRLISLVAAPQGVQAYRKAMPDSPVYAAALDRELNEHGFILPGLGDAGDRLYGTG